MLGLAVDGTGHFLPRPGRPRATGRRPGRGHPGNGRRGCRRCHVHGQSRHRQPGRGCHRSRLGSRRIGGRRPGQHRRPHHRRRDPEGALQQHRLQGHHDRECREPDRSNPCARGPAQQGSARIRRGATPGHPGAQDRTALRGPAGHRMGPVRRRVPHSPGTARHGAAGRRGRRARDLAASPDARPVFPCQHRGTAARPADPAFC